jgi:DNA-binding response OmpR family regulator
MGRVLSEADYDVDVARDGEELLRAMTHRRYDAVVMRDQLTGLSCVEFVTLGRILWPDMPIAVMADLDSSLAELAILRGAHAWIFDPDDSAMVLKIIHSIATQGLDQRANAPTVTLSV